MKPKDISVPRPERLVQALLISFLAGGFAIPSAHADDLWKDIQFGGFASQGYIVNSGRNNYFGATSDGTFDFREYAFNASYATGEWRIGAQAFGQKLGTYGNDRIGLDWATIDYQPEQWFGIRAGRVKTPRGLYNEALDIDSVRPFVLMPQSVYDARLRDFNAAFNGAMVFGNVSLQKAGSLDYRAYYGDIPISTSSGASDYFNNDAPFTTVGIGMDATYGGSLFWNTPVQGFRVGYSNTAFQNFASDRDIILPGVAPFIGDRNARLYDRQLISLEYLHDDWVFALEAGQDTAFYNLTSHDQIAPHNAPGGGTLTQDFKARYAYASVARRLNKHFEVGAYYSYSQDVLTGTAAYTLTQGDYALSVRYDFNEHVLFKVEGHFMDGYGKLFDTAAHPQPVAGRDNSWFLLVAKVTYSF